jgi:hypothetical protein
VAVDGQVGEEQFDFGGAHVAGMAFAVKEDVARRPLDIAVLGAGRVMANAGHLPQLIEQSRRRRQRDVAEIDAEEVAEEEDQGSVGLFEAAEGVGVGDGDVAEKAENVGGAKVARVPFVVEQDETTRPVGMTLDDGRNETGLEADLAQLIEKPRRLGGVCDRRNGHAERRFRGGHERILLMNGDGGSLPSYGTLVQKKKEERGRIAKVLDGAADEVRIKAVIARGHRCIA